MPPSVFLRPARALEAFDMESNFGTGGLRFGSGALDVPCRTTEVLLETSPCANTRVPRGDVA